jgi:hypothetical protein
MRYLLFLTGVLFSASLWGQKQALPVPMTGWFPSHFQKTSQDTLYSHFIQATPTLYASPNGGYVSGNSGFGEKAKLQEFHLKSSSYTVTGFLYWFARKAQNSAPEDSSRLIMVWMDMDSAATVYDSNRVVPRTTWARDTFLLADIDTGAIFGPSLFTWNITPRAVNRNHAVGMRFERLSPLDTVALFSSTHGDAPRPAQSWEFWNGAWRPIFHTWNLDIDFAIFPVVDFTLGVAENPASPFLFPNPAQNFSRIQVPDMALKGGKIHFFTMDGKKLQTLDWPAGQPDLTLDLAHLPTGILWVMGESNQDIQWVTKLIHAP